MERVMKYLQGDYSGVVVGISILVIVLVHYLIKSLLCDQKQGNLPPGPPSWPIIGHLHLLTKDRPAHHTLHSLSQTYGPIMFLRFGSRPVLVVTSSDLARECLTTNDRIFASRPRYAATDHLGYNSTLLGLDPYDHRCRNLSRICKSEILSPARIEMSRHGRSEEISKSVRSLFESAGDEKVDMRSRLLELNFNLIMRVVTDKRYLGNEEEVAEFENMIKENSLLLGAFNVGDYIPWLRWMDLQGFERAMKKLSRRRDEFMQRVVDEHRQRKEESEGNRDLMDVLLSLVEKGEDYCNNDSIVKATAMSMINAGSDTSSNAIEWAMALLIQHPEICNKAQEELDTKVGRDRVIDESDFPNLNYLQAIIKETLRLYPAAAMLIPHMSIEPCMVGGYHVPVGTRLLVNAWAIHRDPSTWDCPLQFKPERFMNRSIDTRGNDFSYIPFGSGRRACPGMLLALHVVELTVGRLLQSFDWSVPNQGTMDMSEGLGITLPKAIPLEASIKPRLPCHLY